MMPILISFGTISITPFTIFLIASFFLCAYLFWFFLHKKEIDQNLIFDLLFMFILFGALFGRIQYIITHFDIFSVNILRSFLFMKYPGFSLGLGLCIVFSIILFFSYRKKLPLLFVLDYFSVSFFAALSLTSLGLFLSGVGYGAVSTLIGSTNFPGVIGRRFPLSLFESVIIFCALGFLLFFHRRFPNHQEGLLFFLSLLFYGFNLFILEIFRVNEVYFLFTFRIGFLIGLFFILIGLVGLYKKGFFEFILSFTYMFIQLIQHKLKLTIKKEN
jgi:phosphatidylglycerol---prolipoprotein diacylglyceryl transferase